MIDFIKKLFRKRRGKIPCVRIIYRGDLSKNIVPEEFFYFPIPKDGRVSQHMINLNTTGSTLQISIENVYNPFEKEYHV